MYGISSFLAMRFERVDLPLPLVPITFILMIQCTCNERRIPFYGHINIFENLIRMISVFLTERIHRRKNDDLYQYDFV